MKKKQAWQAVAVFLMLQMKNNESGWSCYWQNDVPL